MDKILSILMQKEKSNDLDKPNIWKVEGNIFLDKFDELFKSGLSYPSSMVTLGNELLLSFNRADYQSHFYLSLEDKDPGKLKKNIIKKFQQALFKNGNN